eukprot:gnl/Dysnectes_brevis/1679_a1909_1878.p1 GENE.gnl/Dysnectes_brevis/1679_a1909_1878~~gnl/Dysnectes_brevis/1679_a1909_1878.p1  ORF type:complete len:436 (+),score=131.65 gnl/Dysnectes_brevis/1679_a1909_1878:132-1439(+)
MSINPLSSPDEYYELVSQLGEGSYGVIWKARDISTGEMVAIKKVPIEEDYEEILQEVDILKRCDHKNVTKYHGSFYDDEEEELWIVMELCEEGAISDLMYSRGRCLNDKETAFLMRESLVGLQYLHKSRMIHRDIKANNILVTSQGEIKLADFGVSAQLTSTLSKRQTAIGTPFWMAPEVIRETKYDASADIWSLGITLFELMEGKPPLSDMHPLRAMWHIPNLAPPRLGEQHSPEARDFVERCLQKDPAARASSEELMQHPFIISNLGRVPGESPLIGLMAEPSKQAEDIDTGFPTVSTGFATSVDTIVPEGDDDATPGFGFDSGTCVPGGFDADTIVPGGFDADTIVPGGFSCDTVVPTKPDSTSKFASPSMAFDCGTVVPASTHQKPAFAKAFSLEKSTIDLRAELKDVELQIKELEVRRASLKHSLSLRGE